jgi:hypothetical protein
VRKLRRQEQVVVHGERAASVGAVPSVRPAELRASWTTSVTSGSAAMGHPRLRQGHAGDGRNRQEPAQGGAVSLLRPHSFASRDSLGGEGNASRANKRAWVWGFLTLRFVRAANQVS